MLNETLLALGQKRSTIRELFELSQERAKIVGRENIFDFSIGNPSVPPPPQIQQAISEILINHPSVHAYTSAQGADFVRESIINSLNLRFQTNYSPNQLYLTAGAAAALSICFHALTTSPTDEFIVLAPYFPEYLVFIRDGAGAIPVIVPPQPEDFQINMQALEANISCHTRAVIINSPNNPSGIIYTHETLKQLSDLLLEKSKAFGHTIYLISDEPYRELVYDHCTVPFVPSYYENTLLCYSYSKSLSLPGERIGYLLIPDDPELYAAVCGAGRVLGYVNAPSLFQHVIARYPAITADLSVYAENRNLLYQGLRNAGYTCVKPQGAFYLFPQVSDDLEFCQQAKQHDLFVVPGSDFGAPGHIRISYCVSTQTILRALPIFENLTAYI